MRKFFIWLNNGTFTFVANMNPVSLTTLAYNKTKERFSHKAAKTKTGPYPGIVYASQSTLPV